MDKPLAIDLYCGLGGWAEGLLVEGWRVVGFDIERHDYGTGVYPGQLVLQDVTTLHGSQFKDASLIVASPPCQKYSYMAMPWSRAKKLAAWYRESPERIAELNALFNACFRIQREACETAGRHIPLIVENVRGAVPWVPEPPRWNFGSYYLFGDVPALMPITLRAQKFNPDGTEHPPGSWFAIADSVNRGQKTPIGNCSPDRWSDREVSRLTGATLAEQEMLKRPGRNFHAFENGLGSSPSFNGASHETRGVKQEAQRRRSQLLEERVKARDASDSFGWDKESALRKTSSKSDSRKAASAHIAKIPLPLAQHIAQVFK